MNRIHILTEDVRNKIAAGEVIERPVSVIKELVENSIDAKATQITVAIENGGKDLIQVVDDGHGMSEDDALLAFERHSTSKIRNSDDIIHISTLGFRGEALPSIASVSRMTLISQLANSEVATQVDFADGKLLSVSKTSANMGTSIIVKGLFKNIPARRKFLRSESAELKHIYRYFHYQSLLYPQITFRLIINGKDRFHYKKTEDIESRLMDVFGSNFFDSDIIKISQDTNELSLSGYIFGLEESKPALFDDKFIFINGRYISDKTLYHSIRTAYAPFITKTRIWAQGSTPPYILFFNLSPELIDFNVHPAKLEVRFRDSQLVHSFVKNTITSALTSYEDKKFLSAKQKFHLASEVNKATYVEKEIYKNRVEIPRFSTYKKEMGNTYQTDLFKSDDKEKIHSMPYVNPEKSDEETNNDLFPELPNDRINVPLLIKNEEDYVNPWQLHYTYIFLQDEDGLVIIDQHAAHERIIYEKLVHRTKGAPSTRQKLVFPLVIDIPPFIKPLVQEQLEQNLSLLEKLGFVLKKFSGSSIVIEEIPAELDDWQGGAIFIDILKQLQDELDTNSDFRDSLAKSIACKASIKAGKKLSKKEMLNLINDLFACQTPYFCPHGRPLIIKMSLQDFEKRFKRIL